MGGRERGRKGRDKVMRNKIRRKTKREYNSVLFGFLTWMRLRTETDPKLQY